MADTVSIGFLMLWRLAGCPTRTSPSSVKATMEGVVRPPSAFSMTLALFPSITATQELVVPRSMPIAFALTRLLLSDGYAYKKPLEGLVDRNAGELSGAPLRTFRSARDAQSAARKAAC